MLRKPQHSGIERALSSIYRFTSCSNRFTGGSVKPNWPRSTRTWRVKRKCLSAEITAKSNLPGRIAAAVRASEGLLSNDALTLLDGDYLTRSDVGKRFSLSVRPAHRQTCDNGLS